MKKYIMCSLCLGLEKMFLTFTLLPDPVLKVFKLTLNVLLDYCFSVTELSCLHWVAGTNTANHFHHVSQSAVERI